MNNASAEQLHTLSYSSLLSKFSSINHDELEYVLGQRDLLVGRTVTDLDFRRALNMTLMFDLVVRVDPLT